MQRYSNFFYLGCPLTIPVMNHTTTSSNTSPVTIMGIVNLTDNSYFASSRCLTPSGEVDMRKALDRTRQMLEEGADIIDIGACSTRPGSQAVGAEEEWRRLGPFLQEVRKNFGEIRISVDTYWASVVEKTFDTVGPFLVNDISAGEDDPAMLPTVGRLGLDYVAMHKRGNPQTMQSLCQYEDVVEEVLEYFRKFGERAEQYGIRNWILDPGFGFAKTVEQNYRLLANLDRFVAMGRPVLVGVSRKSMIYRLLDITPEEALPQTQVLHFAALERGASILRVHDVAEAVRTVRIRQALS